MRGTIHYNVRSAVCALVLSASVFCASADPFIYVDHWPSGEGDETATEVIVPDNTPATISTADDVARVARLTSISIGDGATVMYNSSTPMTLSAALSGTGSFFGRDSAMLTIAADNSGLTAPGHFAFTNAQVLVSHENGLGAASTGTAVFFFDANSLLDFVANANGVYTNNVAMRVDCVKSNGKLRIGISPRTGRLVQNNDFTHFTGASGGERTVYIDGTMEFISGTISVPVQPGGTSGTRPYLYFGAPTGKQSHLWFSGNLTFVLRYVLFLYGGDIVTHLNGIYSYNADLRYVHMICETEDVLSKVALRPSMDSILDLNGHDQLGKYFDNTWVGGEPTAASGTAKFSVTSDEPAMLTLVSNSTRTNAVKFTGAAGLCHSNTATLAIAYGCSTTTNILDVAKGTVAIMRGASWNSDIRVASDATLELTSVNALTNGMSRLVVEPGGHLLLRNTAVCRVGSALIAGRELTKSSFYTVAKLRDEMGLPVDGDPDACINVSAGEWSGWPDSGDVFIDVNQTVYVSDDDVANVSALSSLMLMNGSRVICTNATVPLVLNANLSGSGIIEGANSAGIILNGDNSSLRSPGTFFFTNTLVVVSNRYGLGSTDTAMVKFYYGDKNGNGLLFRDKGLVVDAPITIYATNSAQMVVGPELSTDTLIVSNTFLIGGTNPSMCFRNKVRLSGGKFGSEKGYASGGHLYTSKSGDYAEVWFDSDVKPQFFYWFASSIVYHLGWNAIGSCSLAVTYLYGSRMVCEKDNLFSSFAAGYGAGQDFGGKPILDLNGHDQTVKHFVNQYNSAPVGLVVTSAVPATVTLANNDTAPNSSYIYYTPIKGNFQGAAALTYSCKLTNDFIKIFSRTTGALTIEKGSFQLKEGAGWGGTNVFVKAGAKLMIAADSMHCAFGNRALLGHRSWTKLDIEAGGTLELAASETPVVVRTLVYNGKIMPAGLYTKSSGVGITGEGVLRVRSSSDGEPGNILIVF